MDFDLLHDTDEKSEPLKINESVTTRIKEIRGESYLKFSDQKSRNIRQNKRGLEGSHDWGGWGMMMNDDDDE